LWEGLRVTDIIEQLRDVSFADPYYALYRKAADEIELLRQRLEFAEFEWNRATASWQEAEKRLAQHTAEGRRG
jgi:hypothetical protein